MSTIPAFPHDPRPALVAAARTPPEERPHVYVYATVYDRYGNPPITEYVGAVEAWAWADTHHRQVWSRSRRKMILADRTSDPKGWRVTFAGLHTHPDDDPEFNRA